MPPAELSPLPSAPLFPHSSAHSLTRHRHGLGLPPAPLPFPQHFSSNLHPLLCQCPPRDHFSQHCASVTSFFLTHSFQKLWPPWCFGPAHLQTTELLWWQWVMGQSSADHETCHVQPKHVILCPGQGQRLVAYSSVAAPLKGCSQATCGDVGGPW